MTKLAARLRVDPISANSESIGNWVRAKDDYVRCNRLDLGKELRTLAALEIEVESAGRGIAAQGSADLWLWLR